MHDMIDDNGEPIIKLYMPNGCDISDYWIRDMYGNLHTIDDGSVWIRYGEYEHGVVYVPEEDLPEDKRLPRVIS